MSRLPWNKRLKQFINPDHQLVITDDPDQDLFAYSTNRPPVISGLVL